MSHIPAASPFLARITSRCLFLPSLLLALLALSAGAQEVELASLYAGPEQRIGQLAPTGRTLYRNYPNALPSLLRHIKAKTTFNVVTEPVMLEDFSDPAMANCPFIYANFADRGEWQFSEAEIESLRKYLTRGGFIYIDAGITASFLREHPELGQHHSYAEWEASPEIKTAFQAVFPGLTFQPLKRSDPLFTAFYQGLPDTSLLPDTVRAYTEQEKWPDGTYSAAALRLQGRIAVLVTPIVAMGWGKNSLQQWETTIQFRILEGTAGLEKLLPTAAYSGPRFEVVREDGGKDVIYCQQGSLPAWAHEPGDKWRVFRYYGSQEISDFAHAFYTRLGTNIIVHALTN
jgi:hypothetical protein